MNKSILLITLIFFTSNIYAPKNYPVTDQMIKTLGAMNELEKINKEREVILAFLTETENQNIEALLKKNEKKLDDLGRKIALWNNEKTATTATKKSLLKCTIL